MQSSSKILIVDDDRDILTAGRLLLKRHVGEVVCCDTPGEISDLIDEHRFDAIMLDMNFSPGDGSGQEGIYWLKKILSKDPDAVVIMITAHGGLEIAVDAMKHGAIDFISKPWQNEKLVATLSAALQLRATRYEAERLKRSNEVLATAGTPGQPMLGNSPAMQDILATIARAAPTDANVLILGENGTGKELLAREIHTKSSRANEVFMAVDLGSLSENLFESELFGHKKGAFSGAEKDRDGRLIAANQGTLFLDEIGNIPAELQAKLLTVLEQRQVTPLGSNTSIPFDVRVIAATNLSRNELYAGSVFREDLLFRLNTIEITLPALRDRADDIPTIAEHYKNFYVRKYRQSEKTFSDSALDAMKAYAWPGNVRALRHAIERAVIMSDGKIIDAGDLQIDTPARTPLAASESTATETDAESLDDLNLERLEKKTCLAALQKHGYNISHAAKALGLTRAALYRRMEKYGI